MAPNRQLIDDLARALGERSPEPVVAAYLFGSHAEGRAHRQSDIDVGILLPWRLDARQRFAARVRLIGYLQTELRVESVDVVVLNDAPPPLAAQVVTRGVRVCCRDEEADHTLRRDAMLRAADLAPFLRRTRRLKLEALRR